jgi:1,4-dihydroxy-2-naphthoate octaprenyltransferase
VLPSIGMGLLSAMILNVNNMRDIANDKFSNKLTIAVRLGLKNARRYHAMLMIIMYGCFLTYSILYANNPWYRFAYIIVYAYQFLILKQIFKKESEALDPYLQKTALSSFLLSVLFTVGINIYT